MAGLGPALLAGILAVFVVGSSAQAALLNDLAGAVKKGTPTLELRLGFEYSDLADNGADPAHGLNLRTRLGYRTACSAPGSGRCMRDTSPSSS